MRSVEIGEAQARLPELVDSAAAGEEIIITRGRLPVASLSASPARPSLRDIRPSSVGAVLKPASGEDDDDLLEEMLER